MSQDDDTRAFVELVMQLQFKRWRQKLYLDAGTCAGLVASLQLSLRHMLSSGATAEIMRRLCDALIHEMDKAAPGIGQLLKKGYDPAHDVR